MAIRARDLRTNIASMGFEKGMAHTLELALEQLNALRMNMHDATELMAAITDRIDEFMQISEGMQIKIDMLRRAGKEPDDA